MINLVSTRRRPLSHRIHPTVFTQLSYNPEPHLNTTSIFGLKINGGASKTRYDISEEYTFIGFIRDIAKFTFSGYNISQPSMGGLR